MDTIDSMIEDWAKARTTSVRESVDAPLDGLEGFSLTQTPATPLDAAKAVRDAVAAKTGRRPKVDFWKPVAAKALGISRLFAKRWQGVLDAGIEAGLFRIESESLKHPFLVALDPEPIKPEPEINPEPIKVKRPKRRTTTEIISNLSSTLPVGWTPPVTLPCGHVNWPHDGLTEDDPKQVEAREAGFCCARVHKATVEMRRINPGTKHTAPVQINWQVRGLHHPIPKGLRRSPERERGGGYPGMCCDPTTGLYIGGIGNNCRHYHSGPERCPVHASKERP